MLEINGRVSLLTLLLWSCNHC